MSKVICEKEDLVAIANNIRQNRKITKEMSLSEIKDCLNNQSCSVTICTYNQYGSGNLLKLTYLQPNGSFTTMRCNYDQEKTIETIIDSCVLVEIARPPSSFNTTVYYDGFYAFTDSYFGTTTLTDSTHFIFQAKPNATFQTYIEGGCCFIPGTQILTSMNGNTKSIETLLSGDEVVAYNVHTYKKYLAKVKNLIVNKNTTDIAEVYFDNGEKLIMNAYHPIYTDEGFHSITCHNGYDELVVGDVVKTADGWTAVIRIKRYTSEPIITYNLDIIDNDEAIDNEENDTFIANGIVVHNAGCPV